MATRTFTDASGVEWLVFDVIPEDIIPGGTGGMAPGYESGWLLFQAGAAKRRLAPFPGEWHTFSPELLETLCARAEPAPGIPEPADTRGPRETPGESPRADTR